MEKFKRNFDKYIVIKVSDLKLAANYGHDSIRPEDIDALRRIQEHIANVRFHRGKPTELVTVVVESDWPEYEPTWEAIEKRCTHALDLEDFPESKVSSFFYFADYQLTLMDGKTQADQRMRESNGIVGVNLPVRVWELNDILHIRMNIKDHILQFEQERAPNYTVHVDDIIIKSLSKLN